MPLPTVGRTSRLRRKRRTPQTAPLRLEFQRNGILVEVAGGNRFEGNWIGVDLDGTTARPNLKGINLFTTSNTVGGATAAARNVISGNTQEGVTLQGGGNLVVGNYIGTSAAGTTAVGNGFTGINVFGTTNNTIGGAAAGSGNLISGNAIAGVVVQFASATGNVVVGNRIGTHAAGTSAVPNTAPGVWILNGLNNTIGGTGTGAGNIISGNTSDGVVLSGSSAVTVANGATLDLNGFSETIGSLAGAGSVTLSSGTLTVGGDTTTTTFSGVISGSGGLTKQGAGTLTLTGNNTYSGATTVQVGTLRVNGSTASSATTVNSGTTLAGTGTTGGVTVNNGGTLAPGDSPGILNTANLNLTSGSIFSVELNGTTPGTGYDRVNVTGTVTLAGTLSVSLLSGFMPLDGTAFTIIDNDGTDAVSGAFAGLAQGATITIGVNTFQINYFAGTGNDVVLVTTPQLATDDFGDSFADATAITLSNSGSGTQSGTIEIAGDVDMFRIVAPLTGRMTVTQSAAPGSSLDTYLYVYNAAQAELGRNDDSGGTLNSRLEIDVTAGTSYYVKAAAFGSSTGAYVVQLSTAATDDFGNGFDSATAITLSSSGSGSQSGTIEVVGDADMLYVYDAAQAEIGRNDDGEGNLNSRVEFDVTPGASYFLKAAAYGSSRGAYVLQFSTIATGGGVFGSDDFANTFASATPITLSSAGSGDQPGTIEVTGDVDMFRVVAPVSGHMTFTQSAVPGSSLDSYLYVYNAAQTELGRNDDHAGNMNSRLEFDATSGMSYFLKAAAYGSGTGAYVLQISTVPTSGAGGSDDFANTFASATPVSLSTSGSGSQTGRIDSAGDVDMFRIVAPVTGRMTITQLAAASSMLDSYLYVHGATQSELGRNDDSNGNRNSRLEFDVAGGTTLYIKAAAFTSSTGGYIVQISTVAAGGSGGSDDFANNFVGATAITLSDTGSGTQSGTIEMEFDVDMFRFVAPLSIGDTTCGPR